VVVFDVENEQHPWRNSRTGWILKRGKGIAIGGFRDI
jgi:hypothetical protein